MTHSYEELTRILRQQLDRREHGLEKLTVDQLKVYAHEFLSEFVQRSSSVEPTPPTTAMIDQVIQEIIGLGVIEPLLNDEQVSEVMVNHYQCVYVERHGKLELTPYRFSSEAALLKVIERIVTPLGRRIDIASPMVDAWLTDGSRVNAVISPLALNGACLTIRKFGLVNLSLIDLVARGTLTKASAYYLQCAVEARQNIVISGGTGTGKTTLLNSLALCVPKQQRIITVEDAAELQLSHPNIIALESRPANPEGEGEVTIRELVRNALRMRPDRIVVGECRGNEALDMLQAMNTGHAGSFTTVHANTPRDALRRLEMMVLMGGFELPLHAIRQQIVSAVDIIIQITRRESGERQLTTITEVVGLEGEVIQTVEIFSQTREGFDYSGTPPTFLDQFGSNEKQQFLKEVADAI